MTNRKVAYIVKDHKPLVLTAHETVQHACPVHEGASRRLGPGDRRTAALEWHYWHKTDHRSRVLSRQHILSLIVTLTDADQCRREGHSP